MGNLNFLEKRLSRLERMFESERKFEGKQVGIIYHVCTLQSYLDWILPNDTLQASGKHYNWLYDDNDYVSFTRDKYFVVGTKDVQKSKVLVQLVVDGDRLSDRYKVGPYNDFAYGPDGEKVDDSSMVKYREMEEVVKGPIKNISKYIKEVRIDVFDMDNAALTKIRRAKLDDQNVKYFHFIKGYQDKSFTTWARENGLRDGTPLNEAMPKFKEFINRNKFNELLFSYDVDDVAKAIKGKADLNAKYPAGYVLETYADDDSNIEIIEMCLDHGANPNLKFDSGETPLTSAAEFNSAVICKALIDAGANVDDTNIDGDTALIIASRDKSKNAVQVLIGAGADVNAVNSRGETAVSVAATKQIAAMLKKAGAV